MHLFPYIFGRYGGGPINELEALKNSKRLQEGITCMLKAEEKVNHIGQKIVHLLYFLIQEADDPKVQNGLLNLKRAIYNKRVATIAPSFFKEDFWNGKAREMEGLLTGYCILYQQNQLLTNNAQKQHEIELKGAIKELDVLCKRNYLSNGFLFASEKLSYQVGKSTYYKKQKQKTVFTLLKYLTRSITKTTPFSTFNAVFCIEKKNDGFNIMKAKQSSCIHPNNLLFLYIKKIMLHLPEAKKTFSLSINTSILETEQDYSFFINIDNNDFLKRIKRTDATDFIKDAVEEKRDIKYGELLLFLQKETGKSEEEAAAFLEQLLSEGFLLIHFPVSIYHENWVSILEQYISSKPEFRGHRILSAISTLLIKVDNARREMEVKESALDRKMILQAVSRQFSNLKVVVYKHLPNFSFHSIGERLSSSDLYYEDFMANDPNKIPPNYFDLYEDKLNRLKALLGSFDEKATIRDLFKSIIIKKFGGKPAPLLSFFQIYFNQKERFETEGHEKFVEHLVSPEQNFSKIIYALENCTDSELDLNKIGLRESENKIVTPSGLFVQTLEGPESPMLVINGELSGYGKNISRFLAYFDPKITSAFVDHLKSAYPDAIIADVHDASIHNANAYPVFTHVQIDIPGSEPDPRAMTKIALTDLFLTIRDNEVVLSLKNGKEILPFNFSMENINRKSSLLKFFELFSVSSSSSLGIIGTIDHFFTEKLLQSEEMIMNCPRVVFDGNIVICRRKWLVKKDLFAQLFGDPPYDPFSFELFLKIINWQKENRIPNEVFIKVKKRENKATSSYKPQYINFEIPLLIACFISLMEEADEIIEIGEMFPSSKDLRENTVGKKYVQEFVLNFA